MTSLLVTALVLHVVLGVIAICLSYLVLMQLLRKTPAWDWAVTTSSWSTFLFFISWMTSAYYYVVYYGTSVKPIIKSGSYPWAHAVLMEGKGHIFLILPFIAITITFALYVLRKKPEQRLKRAVTFLSTTLVILGIFVALSGIAISGAAQ